MRHYNVKPLTLTLQSSRRLVWAFVVAGLIAIAIPWMLPLPWWISLLMLLAIIWEVIGQIRREGLRLHPHACVRLELSSTGTLTMVTRDGERQEVQVLGSSFVRPYLTVLNFKLERGRACCVIVPDAVDPIGFRRLRVWLRWGVHESTEENEP